MQTPDDPVAQYYIAYIHDRDEDDPENMAEYAEWIVKAAENGCGEAMIDAGYVYRYGLLGGGPDYSKMLEWFDRALDAGEPMAMMAMADLYDSGEGVEQSDEKALEWYTKAGEAGIESAYVNLGDRYSQGIGTEEDPAKALEWYTKAADAGDADAQFELGRAYEEGILVKTDLDKAIELYWKADAQVHPGAYFALKRLGQIPEDDDNESHRVWEAMEKGDFSNLNPSILDDLMMMDDDGKE